MSPSVHQLPDPVLRAYRLVNRPYYWFRPAQLLARSRTQPNADGSPYLVRAAWGSELYCWPDSLGRGVARTGVYDLVVAETLARLADPGETAVDAGANVGLMSNLLAHAVGSRGRVISFEPHPLVFETVATNVERWRTLESIDTIDLRQAAVSASDGTLPLAFDPSTFAYNKGTASLEQRGQGDFAEVATVRLDEQLPTPVGVLKLDVEMHELQALIGAERLLSSRLIRDIVFEEHEPPPTPVTELLQFFGYTIFGVRQGLTRPVISTPEDAYRLQQWDPPALLATTDPARAQARLKPRGWICLRRNLNRRPPGGRT